MKKKFNSFLGLIMIVAIIVSMFSLSTTSAGAATNTANSFKQGQLVKCGSYLFSVVNTKSSTKKLVRTKTNGKSSKTISKSLSSNLLCSYKKSVFFKTKGGIYGYSISTNKCRKIASSSYSLVGICSAGVIGEKNNSVYLIKFNKKAKRLLKDDYSQSVHFLGATSRYVFSYYTSLMSSPSYVYVYRYDTKTGKNKHVSTFSTYLDINLVSGGFHTFKNSVVFSLGNNDGPINGLYGEIYKMKTNGTGVKKIKSECMLSGNFRPGKGCVYMNVTSSNQSSVTLYRINSSGKVSKVKTSKAQVITTTNNKGVYQYNGNIYVKGVSASKSKMVIRGSKLINSSYPSDSEVRANINGEYGNMVLVNVGIYTYSYGGGWRGSLYANKAYLVNTKTNKAVKIG